MDAQAQQSIVVVLRGEMQASLREVMQDDHGVIPFHTNIANVWVIRGRGE